MPPRNKFTKEDILKACLEIVREEGMLGITARSVAARLRSSSKVIFGLFANMEELQRAIVVAAEETFVKKVQLALQSEKPFRAVGVAYIQFAVQEPKLFQLIFMNESEHPITAFEDFLPIKDYSFKEMLSSIQSEFGVSEEIAHQLYQHLFIYSHGIASMTAAGIYHFKPEEVEGLLTEVFTALLKNILGGQHD